MDWPTVGRALVFGSIFLTGPACFKDSTASDTGSSTGGCPEGSAGCDCYGNGSCNEGLECTANGKCIETGCTPGEENCSCNAGLCLGGLQCGPDDVCHAGATGTGSTTNTGSTGAGQCSPEMLDNECDSCAKQSCCEQAAQCTLDPDCNCIVECNENPDGCDLEQDCGITVLPVQFEQLLACVQAECPVCIPACNPDGGDVPHCRACTSEACCNEMDQCLDTTECTCMEGCLTGGTMTLEACQTQCSVGVLPELSALQMCAAQSGCEVRPGTPCYGGS